MGNLRRLTFTLVGLLIFVFIPGVVIISLHVEKSMPINDILATGVRGKAYVQYEVTHRIDPSDAKAPVYRNVSGWLPLNTGMKIGSGAVLRTENGAVVDLMLPGRIGLRLNGLGHLRLSHQQQNPKAFDVALDCGKLLCCLAGKPVPKRLQVRTPTAVAVVQGTTFAVDYLAAEKATQVEVLDGVVRLATGRSGDISLDVGKDRMARVDAATRVPRIDYITAAIRDELARSGDLKTTPSLLDRWDRAVDYVLASPMYRKALLEITKYEMKVFIRAIRYFAPLRWGNDMPARLRDVPLEDGDYRDPWETDYHYERLGSKQALLISAGPDRRLHTNDDIVMPIRCLGEKI